MLTWIGAAVTVAGGLGLIACGRMAMKARRLPEAEAKGLMGRILMWNFAALGLAVLGLMAVIAGLILHA